MDKDREDKAGKNIRIVIKTRTEPEREIGTNGEGGLGGDL